MTQRRKPKHWFRASVCAEAAAVILFKANRKAGPKALQAITDHVAKYLDAELYAHGATADQIRQAVRFYREQVPLKWAEQTSKP